MIEQECIDELADAMGIKGEVAAITERAMRGELDFAAALRTRVSLIKGLERKVIEEIRRERLTFAPGSRTLIQTMKTHGAVTSLVSGGFTFFAEYIGRRLGFDEWVANVLEFEGDRLSGTVAEPIVGREMKLERLLILSREHGIDIAATMAVGDGANDLQMIKAAGLGVALHAKPIVAVSTMATSLPCSTCRATARRTSSGEARHRATRAAPLGGARPGVPRRAPVRCPRAPLLSERADTGAGQRGLQCGP
jgi:phosphoserine phosphatase